MYTLAALTLLTAALTAGRPVRADGELRLGFHGETGVESKAIIALIGSISPQQRISASAGLQLAAFQHCGISAYYAGLNLLVSPSSELVLTTALQHQQWNDWQAAENRILGLFGARLWQRINTGLGLCYRAPVSDPKRYCQPFLFSSAAAEWNLLYSLRWQFWQREQWSLSASLANLDRFQVHNPQQLPLAVTAEWSPRDNLLLSARLSTAITGLSAMLISFNELKLEIGARLSHGR